MEKLNNPVGYYKINIYANGLFVSTTTLYETCTEALKNYIKNNERFCDGKKLTATFERYGK